MQSKADRDTSVDALLRATLRPAADAARVTADCVDAETIAAWSDGTLPPGSATRVEMHLSDCARCQAMLAALARSVPQTAAAPSLWRRWQLRWLVPIAAMASALALWVALPSDRRTAAPSARIEALQKSTPPSTAPPDAAVRADELRDAVTPDLDKRAAAPRERPRSQQETTDSTTQNSAPPGSPPPQSSQDAAAAPTVAPAPAAPPAAAAPSARRELSAQRQAPSAVEAVSPNPANRWRIVDRSRIERSTDSGTTWTPVSSPETIELTAIRALSATSAIVTTTDGRRFRTDDEGVSWMPVGD